MPIYIWTAKTKTGDRIKGEMDGPSKEVVEKRLTGQGLNVTNVKAKPKELHLKMPGSTGVESKDLMIFTRQLSTMIDAGLPLVQGLEILATQQENYHFKKILLAVKGDVESGKTFADALRQHHKVFDPLFVNLVAAGEVGGILDTIMARLAGAIEKQVALQKQVKGAMVYPLSIMGVAGMAVAVLMIFVVPVFEKMFADFGGALPAPTQLVIDISKVGQQYWWVAVVAGMVGSYVFRTMSANPKGKRILDRFFYHLPIFGGLIRKIAVARFTRTMGTMLSSGVPIMDGLEIVAKASGNSVVSDGILYTREKVSEGRNMSEPLSHLSAFPPMVVHMVAIGESTGALDTMLNKIADFYEEEVDTAVAGMTSLLEPLIMVFLAIVVGGFLIAMYLPIFTIAGNIQ
jgi:type IV pilus assembly protein PilC